MPKAILSFNLPEEKEEHYQALHGQDYRAALNDLDNFYRSKIKYEDHTTAEYELYQEVRDKIREFVEGLEL